MFALDAHGHPLTEATGDIEQWVAAQESAALRASSGSPFVSPAPGATEVNSNEQYPTESSISPPTNAVDLPLPPNTSVEAARNSTSHKTEDKTEDKNGLWGFFSQLARPKETPKSPSEGRGAGEEMSNLAQRAEGLFRVLGSGLLRRTADGTANASHADATACDGTNLRIGAPAPHANSEPTPAGLAGLAACALPKVTPVLVGKSDVLTPAHCAQIEGVLPAITQVSGWACIHRVSWPALS